MEETLNDDFFKFLTVMITLLSVVGTAGLAAMLIPKILKGIKKVREQ